MKSHFLFILLVAALNFLVFSRFISVKPDSPIKKLDCISYNPGRDLFREPDPLDKTPPPHLTDDLDDIFKISSCIRLYSSLGPAERIVQYAQKNHVTVVLGSYLSKKTKRNTLETRSQVRLANQYTNITMLMVGNENLIKKRFNTVDSIPIEDLIEYIRFVKSQTKQPVSVGEMFDTWVSTPQLVSEVDFIAVHLLPYWYRISSKNAYQWAANTYTKMTEMFPKKFIFIGEIGWPTRGQIYGKAVPGLHHQHDFLKEFFNKFNPRKNALGIDIYYNLVEAYDQPWKSKLREGGVGSSWGIRSANGTKKYLDRSSSIIKQYINFDVAIFTSVFGLLLNFLFYYFRKYRKFTAITYCCISLQACVSIIGLSIFIAISNYYFMGWSMLIVLPMILAIIPMIIVTTKECCDLLGSKYQKKPLSKSLIKNQPRVSIHVACSNEPPEQVINTLKHLLELNYENFEVIVVDNNTTSKDLWMPVKDFCSNHPDKLRFFHHPHLKGYKAGALNIALKETDKSAEYIAIVDSDYIVHKDWLINSLPEFDDKSIAAVQCPQKHFYDNHSFYQRALNDEYDGFFNIGMVQRNFDNAIIMHGTMVMMRKALLTKVGGWSEWSICEDAELGLKLLEQGYQLKYLHHIQGEGLLPGSLFQYKKQRFRWVYGGIRIMLAHMRSFISSKSTLTRQQKYHYFWGWVAWVGDAFYLPCCIFAILIGVSKIQNPLFSPSACFIIPMIFYAMHRITSVLLNYKLRLNLGLMRIVGSIISGLSLTGVVSVAAIYGIFTPNFKFMVTQKMGDKNNRFFKDFLFKTALNLDCVLSIALVFVTALLIPRSNFAYFDDLVWIIGISVLALPGLSSLLLYRLSILGKKNNTT